MTRPLLVSLVGLGVMGKNHARVLQELDGVELVAVVDPSVDLGRHYRPDLIMADVEDAIRAGIDYAVVAAPTELHLDLGVKLAAHGIAFLIEKPVASSVAEGKALLRSVEKAGVIAGVGHIERFNPAIVHRRERVLQGEIGELYQIVTRRQGPFPHPVLDVGVVLDLASHDLHLTSWIADSEYERIHAETLYKAGRQHE